MATPKYYIITDEDKEELEQYRGINILTDEFYSILMKLLRKNKWNSEDLRMLNGMIDDGLGYLLYQLFEEKSHHPLFVRYYGNDNRLHPPRNLEDLMKIAKALQEGSISKDDLSSLGVRVRSFDELIPNDERKEENIRIKSIVNDKSGKKVTLSNKENSYKSK